jgi:hypothetical protein
VGQSAKPQVEVRNRRHALREHCEVTSVDQNVPVRYFDLAMQLMSIAENDQA